MKTFKPSNNNNNNNNNLNAEIPFLLQTGSQIKNSRCSIINYSGFHETENKEE